MIIIENIFIFLIKFIYIFLKINIYKRNIMSNENTEIPIQKIQNKMNLLCLMELI